MKKIISFNFIIFCCFTFNACNTATPKNYFDIAVLNSNTLQGFAGEGLQRELDNPTVKMIDGSKDQFAPMKRKEIIDSKIEYIQTSLDEIKSLKQTDDTKDMVQSSLALYEYVLPVYKNEYLQLAGLYDDGAPVEKIQSLSQSITTKYYSKFAELQDRLISTAKPYAAKHNIQVRWDISTSPQ